jgi:uncharacterized protein YeaO (DUF488 family)
MIKIKRIYEAAKRGDGYRILVDRLWPRGVSKEKAKLNLWFKDIVPSNALRKWFGHDPKKWTGFQKKYKSEIVANKEIINSLAEIIKNKKSVTLLYGAKDEQHNEAIILKDFLGGL